MIVAPANPNVIQVGLIKAGCCKTEFNSAYPSRLNGIISQNEFRESIGNINSKISFKKSKIFLLVVFCLCFIIGLALVIGGSVVSGSSNQSKFIILLGTGIGLMFLPSIFFPIGWYVIRMRQTTQMRKAIAEESKKYSTRSPTSCTWRLNVTRILTGYNSRNAIYFYYKTSDIFATCSFVALILFISGGNYYSSYCCTRGSARIHGNTPPPPYPGQTSTTYCSQCGKPKQDLTAKFCSSCGHSYNNS